MMVTPNRTCKDAIVQDVYCPCNGVFGLDPGRGVQHLHPANSMIGQLSDMFKAASCPELTYNITLEAQVRIAQSAPVVLFIVHSLTGLLFLFIVFYSKTRRRLVTNGKGQFDRFNKTE